MGGSLRRPQLAPLTSVRFFAALHVVLFHVRGSLETYSFPGDRWLFNVIRAGPVSVGLFFVLSGFVLTYTYLGDPGKPHLDRRSFWVARLARIYPVYLLGLLVALPLVVSAPGQLGASVADRVAAGGSVFALVQAWVPRLALAWNPPAWSLSAEAFFYLAFPFAAVPLARLGRRGCLVAIVLLWALALASPAAVLTAGASGALDLSYVPPGGSAPAWTGFLAYNPLVRLPEFLMGVVVARLYLLRGRSGPTPATGSALALMAVAAVVVLLAFDPGLYGSYAVGVINGGALAPLFGLLVYGLACGGNPLAALLSRRPLVLLGEASYALYILHVPLLIWLRPALARVGSLWPLAAVLLYIFTAMATSIFVFRFVEEPARRAIRRRFGG